VIRTDSSYDFSCHPYVDYGFGLTRVNKLFRTEFFPLFPKAAKIKVPWPYLYDYLKASPPINNPSVAYILSMHDLVENARPPGVDILPLLNFDWESFTQSLPCEVEKTAKHVLSLRPPCAPFNFIRYLAPELKASFKQPPFSQVTVYRQPSSTESGKDQIFFSVTISTELDDDQPPPFTRFRMFRDACMRTRVQNVNAEYRSDYRIFCFSTQPCKRPLAKESIRNKLQNCCRGFKDGIAEFRDVITDWISNSLGLLFFGHHPPV
jgi:hypothetical protein